MKRLLLRSLCLAAALLLLLTALPGCQKNNSNPFAQNGFSSITLNKEGEIQATASFNSLILESREGDMVRLYEVLPGDTVANALKKDPITERKIGAEVIFRIPLTDGEHNRIYSSFLLCLSDGTLLTPIPTYVTIPKGYAVAKTTPLLSNTPKGLPAQKRRQPLTKRTPRLLRFCTQCGALLLLCPHMTQGLQIILQLVQFQAIIALFFKIGKIPRQEAVQT